MMNIGLVEYEGSDSEEDEMPDLNTSCKNVQETQDFFGLNSSSDNSDVETFEKSDLDKERSVTLKLPSKNEHETVDVNIPTSDFWNDVNEEEINRVNNEQLHLQRNRSTSNTSNQSKRRSINSSNNIYKRRKYKQTVEWQEVRHDNLDKVEESMITRNSHDSCTAKPKKIYYVHHSISRSLNSSNNSHPPRNELLKLDAHARAVNRIKWCCRKEYSHLLLSASMDSTVKLWNVLSSVDYHLKTYEHHTKAVKDISWMPSGTEFISCGFDQTAQCVDVETGKVSSVAENPGYISCVRIHPVDPNIFVLGSNDIIHCWDRRVPKGPIRNFKFKFTIGQVQDIVFIDNGETFISCNDVVSRDSADRNIVAWDFKTTAVISHQVYQEGYTCTRLKVHKDTFLAQSNGGYIALFSTTKPFKLNKSKRFQGHKVLGYSVGFDISPDGKIVVSGSADGHLYCYDYYSGKNFRKLNTETDICLDVAYHPVLSSTLASCSWDGRINIWN